MEPKNILFDLDGTLTDSGEGIINCALMTLAHYGLPLPSRQEMRVFVGPPLSQSFARYGIPPDQIDNAIAIYRSRYVPIGKFENTPYPGIRELLQRLLDAGCRLYVATSKPEGISIEILEHFGLAKYFTRICGAGSDRLRSTKAQVIAYLMEETGVRDAIMVGDTEYDVLGAREFGIPTIGVSWGFGEVAELQAAGAAAIAHTMDQLFDLLMNT